MSSRRSRFSLSLVRRSESPKSPIGDRARSTCGLDSSAGFSYSTPQSRRQRSSYKNESPATYDCENSPIPMSQDINNSISGVAWAWNSPKRAVASNLRKRPLACQIFVSNKDSEFSSGQSGRSTSHLTGFYKFQSELKMLQANETDDADLEQKNLSIDVIAPASPPSSPGIEKEEPKIPKSFQTDSFNDSELDCLLLQASQAIERKKSHEKCRPLREKSVPTFTQGKENKLGKERSLFKSRTTEDFDLNSDELLNDSDSDSFLLKASQMIEESVTKNVPGSNSRRVSTLTRHRSMPESPSPKVNSPGCSNRAKRLPRDVVVSVRPSEDVPSSDRRQCTKREIEQKRQDALKRLQASRLNKLRQGNHS
ncbi:uncharacterized protein LOC131685840 [Topomyia yanbarensis]|uniref:uncharacterized protein LOC131685840 n=1 Tax=Topomyia yanbarensis TaxID=2498891 RepID=UPI00273AF4DB|nr:uncharacterized protein LOC131685840 [Topomyia yanbarensis]